MLLLLWLFAVERPVLVECELDEATIDLDCTVAVAWLAKSQFPAGESARVRGVIEELPARTYQKNQSPRLCQIHL